MQLSKQASTEGAFSRSHALEGLVLVMCLKCLKYFKTLSCRLIAASWWMFVLLMLSCYTANLAAFLTIDKMDSSINSVEDLLRQNQVKVGVYQEGATVLNLLKVDKLVTCPALLRFFFFNS